MFAEMRSPQQIAPEELDDYLAAGWFRMRQSIFTTHFLCFQQQFYSAIWLRTRLADGIADSTYKQLQKRNSHFTVQVQTASLTRQHELLYKQYKQGITFQTSDNLQQLLYGYEIHNRFQTLEINIYDGDRLIAAGYFDTGRVSAAGIVSFYHPQYKKYSLGKYLIYQKMEYCHQQRIQYFYPGYVAPGYAVFDYKLSIGRAAMQYYNLADGTWQPYTPAAMALTPLQQMHQKLTLLQNTVVADRQPTSLLYYRYFDAALDPYFIDYSLLQFPVFLYQHHITEAGLYRLVVYDVSSQQYQLLSCSSISQMDYFESSKNVFGSELLQVEEVLLATPDLHQLAAQLKIRKKSKR
jgi:leucyl-tRNA---protein transferase